MKLHALLFALLLLIVPGVVEAEPPSGAPITTGSPVGAPHQGLRPQRSSLVYKVPEGFLDVSPGAPKANFKDLAQDFVAESTSGRYEAFALGPRDKKLKEAFEPRFLAWSSPEDAPVTEILVEDYVEEMIKASAAEGHPARLLQKELCTIGGARAGRVLLEKAQDEAAQRMLIYLVPDGDLLGTLMFMSDASTFDRHLPAFEAAASGTSGVVPSTNATLRRSALDAIRAAGLVSTVPAAASPFRFSLPPGMTDVATPGFDAALADAAARANFATYAVGDDGETFNAVVMEGRLSLAEADLDPMAQAIERSFAEAGKTAKVTERSLVDVGALRVARLMFDLASDKGALRGVVYAVPGASHYARLTYLSSAQSFARLLPGFEASAGATTGVASPEPLLTATRKRVAIGVVALLVLIPALVLGIGLSLRGRRQSRAA